jgi:uncharacterized protein with HEPN domain
MARDDRTWADDIITAITDIRADTTGIGYPEFVASPRTVRSVLYSIGVIGEAAKNLSPEFRAAHPTIPWRAIAGMRDRVVHEYFRTDTRRIWDVVEQDLEPLERSLRSAAQPPDPSA